MFGEEMLKGYHRAYGITAVAFRLMGVHYPHNDNSGQYDVTPVSQPDHRGGPIKTTYQYVDARDVANACVLAIDAANLDGFEAFYLSTDTVYSEDTKDLVARVWPDLAPDPGHRRNHHRREGPPEARLQARVLLAERLKQGRFMTLIILGRRTPGHLHVPADERVIRQRSHASQRTRQKGQSCPNRTNSPVVGSWPAQRASARSVLSRHAVSLRPVLRREARVAVAWRRSG
jgi:hypothetical protein